MTVLCMAASFAFAQNYTNNFQNRRFDSAKFHLLDNDETIINMGTHGMTVLAKGSDVGDANVVYYDATDKKWEAEAHFVLQPTSEGGLVLMKDRSTYWGITATPDKIFVRTANKTVKEIRNSFGRFPHLRLQYANGKLTISVAPQNGNWKLADNGNPTGKRKPATKWTVLATLNVDADATHIAMSSAQKGVVSVRDFWYRKK